jgi:IclR family acetate operon transcriptional repressor
MPIPRSLGGARILTVLEKIAQNQPVGLTDLARLAGAEKSAVQRAILTLADAGWIRAAPGKPTRWELTSHIHSVAQHATSGHHDLRRYARTALEALRDQTGESVLLNVPQHSQFVVIDVLESRNYLRTAPPIGMIVSSHGSATSRALLPFMTAEEQRDFLGAAPNAAQLKDFAATAARGYVISRGDVVAGSTNIAAPIFDKNSRPVAAVLVSAPTDRTAADVTEKLGSMVAATARKLSRGAAPRVVGRTEVSRGRRTR